MTPAAVTDALLHDLVTFARAEGDGELAVAAVLALDDRVLFCGRPTADFGHTWDLPGGTALPGETFTDALARILAVDYGLSIQQIPPTSAATSTCSPASRPARSCSPPPAPTRTRSAGTPESRTAGPIPLTSPARSATTSRA